MVPVPFPLPVTSPETMARLDRLENALVLTLDFVDALVARLETKLGSDFVSGDLARIVRRSPIDAEEQVAEIDELLWQNQHPKAVRRVRELMELTWDEANAVANAWRV